MAQVAPLRECPSMVVVSTAIRSRSIYLGASHHCCSVLSAVIFERFHSHSLLQGGRYLFCSKFRQLRDLRLSGSAALRVALPVTVTDLSQVSLFIYHETWELAFYAVVFLELAPPPPPPCLSYQFT
jgi:hypothetical protein